jgi:N-acetylmuramoyl-L-alanine amidase
LLLLAPLLLGVERPPGLGDVNDVRTWSHADYTRVVVELSRSVEVDDADLRELPPDPRAKRPARRYIDLPGIWVGKRFEEGVPVADGLLKSVRLGQNTLTRSRVVIDLERYARHRMFTLQAPDRLVIDIYGSRDEATPAEVPSNTRDVTPSRLSLLARPVRTVVIDPGHGGKDPGATGYGGLREKDVNLRLSRLLARRLESRGFRVVMTRDDDRFLSLEDRTVVAESAGGDVFVSIHANATRNRATRGIEIYYLNANHERHSLDVAARENGIRVSEVDGLQRALARLRVSEVSEHSRQLAHIVHEDLLSGLGKTYGRVPDLGVKKGPFYVLFMTSMPAILIETGFVTNREDARRLRDGNYLDTLAAQIAAGLGHYRNRRTQQVAAGSGGSQNALPAVGARE